MELAITLPPLHLVYIPRNSISPFTFLCFVNDIPLNVTSKIKLYADDILLYRTINLEADCTLLQKDINNLIKWSKDWQLLFNFDKYEFLLYFQPTIWTLKL